MSPVAFHFAGGDAFFSGVILILAACGLACRPRGDWKRRTGFACGVVGASVVGLSGTPLPLWIYAIWTSTLVALLIAAALNIRPGVRKLRIVLASVCASISLSTAAWELSYRIRSPLPAERFSSLSVIGDSISAGMLGPDEATWTKQLAAKYDVRVIDVSEEGATARSALAQAARIDGPRTLVLLEIGGNDLFGRTTSRQFAGDLEELLKVACRPERLVVMLELPLPPFYNGYGRVQRRLAKQYGVSLISKRPFMSVFASPNATLDGIHLSETGHALMAEMIWHHLGPLLESPRPVLDGGSE